MTHPLQIMLKNPYQEPSCIESLRRRFCKESAVCDITHREVENLDRIFRTKGEVYDIYRLAVFIFGAMENKTILSSDDHQRFLKIFNLSEKQFAQIQKDAEMYASNMADAERGHRGNFPILSTRRVAKARLNLFACMINKKQRKILENYVIEPLLPAREFKKYHSAAYYRDLTAPFEI